MLRLIKPALILCCIFTFIVPHSSRAQIDDIGLWLGLSAKKQITRKWEGSLSSQLRLDHDITEIDQVLVDAGMEYSISSKIKSGIHYRFINSNQENYYSKRHRFYLDLSYKEKIDFITLTLRERIQEQFSDYYSSETGKIPIWNLRSKLTAKFDVNKKYSPYLSVEMYYLIDNAKEHDGLITRFRYETGFDYEFNRAQSLNPYVLLQSIASPGFMQLIYGVTYSYSF